MGKHPCLNILKGNKHLEEAFKNIDENLSEAEQRVQILETAKKYHKQLFTDLNELKQKAGENLKPSQKKYVEQDRTKEIEAIKKEYQQKIDSLSKPVAENVEGKKADIERRRQENPSVERGVLINYESGKTKEQLIDIVNKLKNGEINLNEIIKEFFNLPINTLSEVKEAFKEGTLADKIQFGLDTNELSDLQPKTRSRESIINAKQKALFQKQKTEEALKDSEYKTVKKTDPITGKVTETKVKRTAEEKTKYDDFHKKALEDVNKEIEKYDAELKELENNNPTLPTNETEQTTVAGEQSVSTDVEVKKATISINGRDTTYTQNDQGEWVSPNGAVAKGNNLKKIEAQIQQNQPSQQSTKKTEDAPVPKIETKEPSQDTKETIVKVKLGDKLVKGETVLWNGVKHEVVKQNSDGTFNIKDSNGKVIKEVMANDKEFGGKVVIESNNLQKVSQTATNRKNSLSQDQKTELSKIIEVHDEEVNPTSDLVEKLRSHESDQVKDLVKTYDKADKSTKESREAANDAFEKGVRDLIVNDRQKLSQEELQKYNNQERGTNNAPLPLTPQQKQATKDSITIFHKVVRNIAKRLGIPLKDYRKRLTIINAKNSVEETVKSILNSTLDNSANENYSDNTDVEVLFQSDEQIAAIKRIVPSLSETADKILLQALAQSSKFNTLAANAGKEVDVNLRTELNKLQKELAELFKNKQGNTPKALQLKEEVEEIKDILKSKETVKTLSKSEVVKLLEDELVEIKHKANTSDYYYIEDFSDAYIDAEIEREENLGNQATADAWKYAKTHKEDRAKEINAQRQQQKEHLIKGLNYLIGNNDYSVEFQFVMVNATLNYNVNNEGYLSKRNANTVGLHNEMSSAILPIVQEELQNGSEDNPIKIYNKHNNKDFLSKDAREEIVKKYAVEKRPGGIWLKFPQNSSDEVVMDLHLMAKETHKYKPNGSWCTGATFTTAKSHNSQGDFYIFVDTNYNTKLAMKYNGSELGESRGIGSGQSVTDEDIEETSYFYEHYPNGKKFINTKDFNLLYKKYKNNDNLDVADIPTLIKVYNNGDGSYDRETSNLKIQRLKDLLNSNKETVAEYLNVPISSLYIGDISNTKDLKGVTYLLGSLDLSSLTSAEGLTLPTTIGGSLDLSSLTSAEGLTLPTTIGGSLDLSRLTSAEGLTLPTTIGGALYLRSLTSAEGLTFPTTIGEYLDLSSLTSAEGLTFPTTIGRSLVLSSLTSAEGLTFPTTIGGALYLRSLTSAEGLTLPTTIGGSLDLSRLTSAEGLTLPTTIGGSLDLSSLTSAEGLTFPTTIGGALYLRSLTSAEGLTLPTTIGEALDLSSLTSAEGLTFPTTIGRSLVLGSLTSAEGLTLPTTIGGYLDLRSLTSAEGLTLPTTIGGSLDLRSLTSAEGLTIIRGTSIYRRLIQQNSDLEYNFSNIKDRDKIKIIDVLKQDKRGAIVKTQNKSFIVLGKKSDETTRLHEITHEYERVLTKEEKTKILQWVEKTKWSADVSEAFAKGFEKFLYEGKVSSKEMQNVFERFAFYLKTLIKDAIAYFGDINELNQDMIDIYNQMVASNIGEVLPPVEVSSDQSSKGWKNLFKPKHTTQQPSAKSKAKTSTAKEPQGKLLTEKGFNAVGKGQTRLSSVAEQTNRSDPNFNRLVDIIKKLIPSLLASDIKLYVYPSKEAMAQAMEQKGYTYENESAFFDNNEIHLDLSSASSEVPIHEIIHPILNKILENSPELYKSLANQVKHLLTQGDKDALKAQGFSENYKGESQKMDEMVVQYLANKVANEIQLGNTNTSLIKGFVKGIKAILGKLGIFSYGNILSKDLSTLETFAKNLAEGIENGFKIQEVDSKVKPSDNEGKSDKSSSPKNSIQASRHNPITRSYKDLVITLRAIEEQYKNEMPSKDELKAYALELGYDANEFDEAYADFKSVQKNISQHLRQFSEVTEAAFQDDLKRKTFEQALERGLRKIPNLLDHPASLEENVLVLAQKYLNGDTDVNIDEDYAALLSMTASNILSNINQFNEQLNGLSGSANSNEELYRTIMQQVSNASVRYEVIASALIKTGREAARVLAYRKELLFKQEIEARREELQALLNKTDKEANKKEIQELIKMNEYLAKQGLNLDSLLQSLVDGTLAITKTRATEMVKALSKTPTKSVKAKIEALKRYSQTGSFKQASRDTPINEASEEEIRQMNMDRRRIIHDLTAIVAAELPQDKLDLAELAKKMNEFVKENELNQGEHPITEVTESELIDTLSQSHPDSKKQVLSEGAKAAKELRRQAALVDKIQKLLNGEFSPNPKVKKREISNRTQDLINLVDNLKKAFDKNNLTEEDKVTLQNLIANLNLADHLGITDPAEIAFDEAKQSFAELMDNTRLSKLQKEAEQLEKDLALLASSTGGDLETAIEDIRNKQKGKAQTYKSKKTEEALAKNIAMRKALKEAVRDKNKEALEELAKLEKQAEDLEKDLHLLRDKKEVVSSEQIDALFKKYYKPASPAKGVAIQRQMQHNIGIRANIKKRLEDYEKSNSDSKWVRGAHKLAKGVDKLNNLLNSLLLAFDMSVYGTFTALSMYRIFTDPVTREAFFQNLKHAGNAWSKLAVNHDTEEFKAYQEANKQTVENPDGTTDELVPTFADFVNRQFDEFIAAYGITEDQLHEWGVKRPFDFAKEDDLSMFRNFATNEKTRLTAALARSNAALALYRSQLMALDNKRWNDANPNATPEERKRYAEHVNWMYFSPKVTTFSGTAWRFLTLAPRYKLAIFRNLLASPFYLLGALGDVTGISPDPVAKSIAAKYIFPFLVTAALYGIALAMMGGYDREWDWTDKNFLKLVKYVKNGEGLTDEKDPLFIFGPALRFILSFIHITNYSMGWGTDEYQAKLGDRFGDAMTKEGSPVAVFMNEIQRWMGVAPQFILESASGSDFGGKRRYDLKEPENPRLKAYAKAALEHFSPLPLQSALPPDGNWNVPLRHPMHYVTNLMANSLGIKSKFDYRKSYDPKIKNWLSETGIKLDINPKGKNTNPLEWVFKTQNNNPLRDDLRERVTIRLNIWFNEEMEGDIDKATSIVETRNKKPITEIQKKFEEIAAEERKAIYTEQEEMGEGRVKDILHRYAKITTKSLEEYKKQAEEYEDEK